MAWDHEYHTDPATGEISGPYRAWQVIGCVLCLITLNVAATFRMSPWLVLPIMPAAFTMAWSWTAAGTGGTGLWPVGALLILVGTLAGTAVVSGSTAFLRSKSGRA